MIVARCARVQAHCPECARDVVESVARSAISLIGALDVINSLGQSLSQQTILKQLICESKVTLINPNMEFLFLVSMESRSKAGVRR